MQRRTLLTLAAAPLLPCELAFANVPARPVTIGVLPGPHREILACVRDVAAAQGLDLRIVDRSDGQAINADVARGRLDAACFQDGVSFARDRTRYGKELIEATRTVTQPVALYSRRITSPRQLSRGATLAIPRDPPLQARALVLLHNHGLVVLRDDAGLTASTRDVVGNRHQFRLDPLPAGRLADALCRVDLAVIDRPTADRAGLLPARDSIGVEDARTPWSDVLAVRAADRSANWVGTLVASYRSEPIKRFILERYQESVRRPW